MAKDRILVGRFGAPHGVGGELRLTSFTAVPGAIGTYKPLLDGGGKRQFSIIRLRPLKDNMFIAKVAGVANRASAQELTNTALYVPRDALPEAGEEEFYLADLIGLTAITEEGVAVGCVVNVLNFGGGDIVEIARSNSEDTLLLPFKKEVFPHIDLKAAFLTFVPPAEIDAAMGGQKD